MIIYKAQNKINSMIYIGQTINSLKQRINTHFRRDETYFDKALRKYGLNSFDISIIDDSSILEELKEKEKYWIRFYNCISPNGYNLTQGGEGLAGYKHTEETREKLRESRKNQVFTDEHRKRMSEVRKGKSLSEEAKRKVGIANKGRHQSEEQRRKNGDNKRGKPLSLEHRRKMSEAHKGIIFSQSHLENIKKAAKLREENKKLKLVQGL